MPMRWRAVLRGGTIALEDCGPGQGPGCHCSRRARSGRGEAALRSGSWSHPGLTHSGQPLEARGLPCYGSAARASRRSRPSHPPAMATRDAQAHRSRSRRSSRSPGQPAGEPSGMPRAGCRQQLAGDVSPVRFVRGSLTIFGNHRLRCAERGDLGTPAGRAWGAQPINGSLLPPDSARPEAAMIQSDQLRDGSREESTTSAARRSHELSVVARVEPSSLLGQVIPLGGGGGAVSSGRV